MVVICALRSCMGANDDGDNAQNASSFVRSYNTRIACEALACSKAIEINCNMSSINKTHFVQSFMIFENAVCDLFLYGLPKLFLKV